MKQATIAQPLKQSNDYVTHVELRQELKDFKEELKQEVSEVIQLYAQHTDGRFETIQSELERINMRLDRHDTSIDALTKIAQDFNAQLTAFLGLYQQHDHRIERLEAFHPV